MTFGETFNKFQFLQKFKKLNDNPSYFRTTCIKNYFQFMFSFFNLLRNVGVFFYQSDHTKKCPSLLAFHYSQHPNLVLKNKQTKTKK